MVVGELVVVDDLDAVGVAVLPDEAESPLVVDADGVLADAVPLQRFEPGGRRSAWGAEVAEVGGRIEHDELAQGAALDVGRDAPARAAVEEALRVGVGEGLDQGRSGKRMTPRI